MSEELIQVILNDKSATTATMLGSVGATVIKATRGGNKPVRFEKRQTKRITDYLGIPNTGCEGIDDVIQYNNKYPIWVSAPSTGGKYGGVLVTKTGTIPFVGGKDSKTIDFTAIKNTERAATLAGATTEVTFVISDFSHYVHQSVDILVNGVSITIAASDAEPEVLTSTPDIGTGTFTRATGTVVFTFTTAPIAGTTVDIEYDVDRSADAYFALLNVNPQVDDLKVMITKNTLNDFVINLYKKAYTSSTYASVQGFPKTGSTIVNKKNGYSENIYLPVLFDENNDYIQAAVNTSLALDTFTADTAQIAFVGGIRGTTAAAQLATGWEYFKAVNTYKADVFFDTTAETTIPAIFEILRTSYQKYSYYILPTTNVAYDAAITATTSIMTDNKGIAFYWGWGKVSNTYTGDINMSSLMGRRALRLADMYDCFNGLAPAMYNENATHGGQLGSGIIEMFYDANDDQQILLENARINPTVVHPAFGVCNTRERTSQSLQSDYSSIGHTRLADYLINNIVTNALPYQSYKLNDTDHRARVKSQIENIISPTISAPFNLLRDYIVKVDEENNNDEVLAREEFVVSVAIKFTPFSKYILLFFTTSAQGTAVSEDVI